MNTFLSSSRADIINNQQRFLKRVKYVLHNMNACSDVGIIRKNQEDAVLLLEHVNNIDFKLLAVADGMGGLSYGEIASNLALLEIIKWFDNLPLSYYYSEAKVCKELKTKLYEVDSLIRKVCIKGGTTLALAVICKKNTFFTNIGDSRIYLYYKNNFEQITNDHSPCYDLYLRGIIKNKDDIRFHQQNHLISSCLGGIKPMIKMENIALYNSEYDNILLVTDGVSDCLPEDKLKDLIDRFQYDNCLSEVIVDQSLLFNSINKTLDSLEYYDKIIGGKDNTTAAVFSKKR